MGLFFFFFSCQTTREENMGYYETNNYNLKEDLYMSTVVGYFIGMIVFCVIMIWTMVQGVRTIIHMDNPDPLYEELRERVANMEEEQRLDK